MTDEQLRRAACHVCQMRGLNPHNIVTDGLTPSEQWQVIAREVMTHYQIAAALRCAGVSP